MFLGIAIAVWVLRGFGIPILTAIPGGLIWLLLLLAIGMGIMAFVQKTWWRFLACIAEVRVLLWGRHVVASVSSKL
ncbi:MAG: hypothetical protein HC903_06980 [Methylacidiphilales bacterium]|nr:hypothetical protein [Candidatus Methylacidiphilales bacterium]